MIRVCPQHRTQRRRSRSRGVTWPSPSQVEASRTHGPFRRPTRPQAAHASAFAFAPRDPAVAVGIHREQSSEDAPPSSSAASSRGLPAAARSGASAGAGRRGQLAAAFGAGEDAYFVRVASERSICVVEREVADAGRAVRRRPRTIKNPDTVGRIDPRCDRCVRVRPILAWVSDPPRCLLLPLAHAGLCRGQTRPPPPPPRSRRACCRPCPPRSTSGARGRQAASSEVPARAPTRA